MEIHGEIDKKIVEKITDKSKFEKTNLKFIFLNKFYF